MGCSHPPVSLDRRQIFASAPEFAMTFPDDLYVIDVGMNDGKDSEYYARRGFKVIAYEANPEVIERAGEKLAPHGDRIEVRNRAIAHEAGELTFYVNKFNDAWSSLNQTIGSRRSGSSEIRVQTVQLQTDLRPICEAIHFVKIDIEGYDEVALRQVLELPVLPTYLSVENGSRSMIERMGAAGYTGFKFSNQLYVPAQRIPADSKHGRAIEHSFLRSSSGLFGEDLQGRWLNQEEALKVIEALDAGRRLAPNNLWAETIGWFDLHAKRET